MVIQETTLQGVWVVELSPHPDARGYFLRTFCAEEFERHSLNTHWVQCNMSYTSVRGMLRGMHFQKDPSPEIKLVQCVTGVIQDVVVDVRKDSPTFGCWLAYELSERNHKALYIPSGFAHGFQCLSDDCRVSYQMSSAYDPSLTGGVRWDDPDLAIEWPLSNPVVSERDSQLPVLSRI